MNSLSATFVLYRKEIGTLFISPVTYIIGGIFTGLMGYLFFNVFVIADQMRDIPFNAAVMRPLFGNMNTLFIFIVPVFAMRLICEEIKTGTIQMLYLSPLKDFEIILGKFLAGMTLISFYLGLTLIFPLILHFSGYANWEATFTGYLGLILNTACYFMFSFFISSLTRNQALAVVASMIGLLFFIGLAWTAQTTQNPIVSTLFEQLSLSVHFEPFSRGVIKSYDFTYYVFFFMFFWLLSLRSLDSRNW